MSFTNAPHICKRGLLGVFILAGLPLALLAAAETGLRVAGYGESRDVFVARRLGPDTFQALNRHFFEQFLDWSIRSEQWDDEEFDLTPEKPPNTCRIFFLGSSAAQGWTDPAFGYWRMLEAMLRAQWPSVR